MRPRFAAVAAAAILLLSSAAPSRAAELYFGAPAPAVGLHVPVEIGVFLDTQGAAVNAVEGTITFPADRLTPTLVRDAGSVVSLWIERPAIAPGRVRFSGVIPGGFTGPRGPLFSVVFEATAEGAVAIQAADDRILLNDGQGTPAALTHAPLALTVRAGAATPPFLLPHDAEAPEPFAVRVAHDPNLLNDRWFAAFNAQDKQSGIDHYELAELPAAGTWLRWFRSTPAWRIAESPAPLADQRGWSDVYVKAVDRSGNARTASATAPVPPPWYERDWFLVILAGVLALAYASARVTKNLWRKPPADSARPL